MLEALFIVPLLDIGIGIGMGEAALRRCCDKGEELDEPPGVKESNARSGSSSDLFFVRRER